MVSDHPKMWKTGFIKNYLHLESPQTPYMCLCPHNKKGWREISVNYFLPFASLECLYCPMGRKRPCTKWCTLLGIHQVAQLTLQRMNALWMHNGLTASAITEVMLMQNCSFPTAIERYSEAPACDRRISDCLVPWGCLCDVAYLLLNSYCL